MPVTPDNFAAWLAAAQIPEHRLTPDQRGVLHAAFGFRRRCGDDYYSTRLLSHFLLHCDCGLQVAQIARLVGCGRSTASRQRGLSSKEAIQQAHHRLDGRPYGKLLPRYAGPIAEYLFRHPQASRADLIDFVDQTWGVRVSRIALYHFLKKYGLDQVPNPVAVPATAPAVGAEPRDRPRAVPELPPGRPVPSPAPPFSPRRRSTPAPSSSCRTP
jgi:hypothetical protein